LEESEFLKSLEDYENLAACPIATGFRILGKRWTIEVVRQLFLGDLKFNQLLKNTPGINPRMLSLRLQELEGHGLVKRTVVAGRPVAIDYTLTKEGMDLVPVMFAMTRFSMKNFSEVVFHDAKSRSPKQVTRELDFLGASRA
jgi:DNA-binding HxlR family transcriptional regulator